MQDLSLKEIVAALIAVAIAAVTLWLILSICLNSSLTAANFQQAAQILSIALALMGTVTGYYFGRIPAEAHAAGMERVADAAQQATHVAQTQATESVRQAAFSSADAANANAAKDKIVTQVQSLRDGLSAGPIGGGPARAPELDFVIGRLNQILQDYPTQRSPSPQTAAGGALPSFLQPIGPLVLATAAFVGGAAPTTLAFSMQPQQQSEWCWAATSASVSLFFNGASTWTQCGVAAACLGQDCCATPDSCNQPYYLDNALTTIGNLAGTVGGAYQFSGVQAEINAGRPVCCHIAWQGGGGHFVAIYGYDAMTQDLEIGDPYYGSSTVPYSTFVSAYRGTGIWDFTYTTS